MDIEVLYKSTLLTAQYQQNHKVDRYIQSQIDRQIDRQIERDGYRSIIQVNLIDRTIPIESQGRQIYIDRQIDRQIERQIDRKWMDTEAYYTSQPY